MNEQETMTSKTHRPALWQAHGMGSPRSRAIGRAQLSAVERATELLELADQVLTAPTVAVGARS